MTDNVELERKFWKSLKGDRTFLLGLLGVEEGHAQPMTAQLDEGADDGPIYIFTSTDTDLVKSMGRSHRAFGHFSSKGHDLFASFEGELALVEDRETIDRLWNPYVAAWFEGGKTDPKVQLLRFDAQRAQIWLNEHSLLAGVKLLLGRDPKEDFKDKVADVRLN